MTSLRRRLAALLLAAVWMLAGCGGARADRLAWNRLQNGLAGEWKAEACAKSGGQMVSLALRRSPAERLEIQFTAPDTLAGLRVTLLPDRVEMAWQGLGFTIPPGRLPEGSVAGQVAGALEKIQALQPEQLHLERQGGKLLAEGEGLQLTAGLEHGNLLTLAVPGGGLELELEDFQNLRQ